MPATIRVDQRGPITYSSALRKNEDVINQAAHLAAAEELCSVLWESRGTIDLEWICSLPAEMLAVPYWLTGRSIDGLVGDDLVQFDQIHREFMEILETEEGAMTGRDKPALARIMREGWESGAVLSFVSKVEEVLSEYWCQGSAAVVRTKVTDNEKYERELGFLFEKN